MSKTFKKNEPRFEVLNKLIDFRKVILGDKIKQIYSFVSEKLTDEEIEDN